MQRKTVPTSNKFLHLAHYGQHCRGSSETSMPVMASGTTTTEGHSSNVLAELGFTKLSDGMSLYTPTNTSSDPDDDKDPTILVLCSWAFAQPRHIAKYIHPYQILYPRMSILLVQNALRNNIYVPDVWQYAFFQPAAAALQAHLSSTPNPRVLMHIFSNGGAHAAVQLSETCRETCGGLRMPVDALVLDSCPGMPRFAPTVNAVVQGLPSRSPVLRGFVTALAWMMVGTTALLEYLSVIESVTWKLYRKLYDPYDVFVYNGNPESEKERALVPRSYIYSKTDAMVFDVDVEAHAKIVEDQMKVTNLSRHEVRGMVKLEKFVGTAHVNHVKNEPERYWGIVKETWERRQRS